MTLRVARIHCALSSSSRSSLLQYFRFLAFIPLSKSLAWRFLSLVSESILAELKRPEESRVSTLSVGSPLFTFFARGIRGVLKLPREELEPSFARPKNESRE